MPEVLRDLVVSLSLKTDNFTRNINSINRQIRERRARSAWPGPALTISGIPLPV